MSFLLSKPFQQVELSLAKLLIPVKSLSLTHRFMLASFVVLVMGMIGIGLWIQGQIEEGVLHRTGLATALYIDSFIEPALQSIGADGDITETGVETLDRLLSNSGLAEQFIAFKIWDTTGRVIYSTNSDSVGEVFDIKGELASALNGEVSAQVTDLTDEENRIERQVVDRSIEVYTPVHELGSGRVIAVAEFYQRVDGLDAEIYALRWRSWLVFGAAAGVMYLLHYILVRSANRTIEEQQAALQEQVSVLRNILAQNKALHRRVRNGAAHTSALNERTLRRIGSELHDGPIQHLSLALLHVEGIRQSTSDENRDELNKANSSIEIVKSSLSNSLQELRAIASGMGLPELEPLTLSEAIKRVVRTHERQTQTKVNLRTNGVDISVPLPAKIVLYRVVQEALNNAFRHAGGVGQEVSVELLSRDEVYLEVSDTGPGIKPQTGSEMSLQERMGLIGMRERVESLGGIFNIAQRSQGTAIRVWLPILNDESVN